VTGAFAFPAGANWDLSGLEYLDPSDRIAWNWSYLTYGKLRIGEATPKMYWTDTGVIRRANLDGTAIETVISSLSGPVGLALDVAGSKIYFTNSGSDKIQRANFDGSGLEDLVTTGLDTPWGIVLVLSSNLEFLIA